jgi:hypothetical protein
VADYGNMIRARDGESISFYESQYIREIGIPYCCRLMVGDQRDSQAFRLAQVCKR